MKANEIQIGDWVEPRQCMIPTVYCKVEGIYPDGTVHLDKAEMLFTLDELAPVPLTPEILEKNGFYYDENKKAYLMGVIFQIKSERYGLFSFKICGCPYSLNTVHELQHALRLCGIEKTIEL